MINIVLDFLKTHYKTIIKVIFGLFIIYWLLFFLTPKVQMAAESKQAIDSLNVEIKEIEKQQDSLSNSISEYKEEINLLDQHITTIQSQKTIIKEIYHEEIKRVNNYTDHELDSFFTVRYGYYTR
jgi:vacuolar-type H+-ATPase subunit I/STV1